MGRYEINGVWYNDELGRIEGLSNHEAFILTAYTGLVFMDFGRFQKKIDKHFKKDISQFEYSHQSDALLKKFQEEFKEDFHKVLKRKRVKEIYDLVNGAEADEQSF